MVLRMGTIVEIRCSAFGVDPILAFLVLLSIGVTLLLQAFTINALVVVALLVSASLIYQIWRCAPSIRLNSSAVSLALTALVLWCALSVSLSPTRQLSIFGWIVLSAVPAGFLLCIGTAQREPLWRLMLQVFVIAAGGLSTLALAQQYVHGLAPAAFFVQPNSLAGCLLLLVMPITAVFLQERCARRVFLGVVLFISYFAIASVMSRGALVAFWSAFMLLLWATRGCELGQRPRAAVALALWAFLLANMATSGALANRIETAVATLPLLLETPASRDIGIRSVPTDSAVNERFLIWRASWNLLRETPWRGFGPGTFHLHYPRHRLPQDTSAGQYAHNDYLQFGIELGAPGLAIILALMFVITRNYVRVQNQSRDRALRLDCAGAFCSLAAVAAHSVFSYDFYVVPTALLFGVVLARFTELTTGQAAAIARPAVRIEKTARLAICVSLFITLAVMLLSVAAMNRHYQQGLVAMSEGRLQQAERSLTQAARLLDTDGVQIARATLFAEASLQANNGRQRRQLFTQAEAALSLAEQFNPLNPEPHFLRGKLYVSNPVVAGSGWTGKAAHSYDQALLRDPRHYRARMARASLLAQGQEIIAARRVLEAGVHFAYPRNAQVISYGLMLDSLRRRTGDVPGAERLEREVERLARIWL